MEENPVDSRRELDTLAVASKAIATDGDSNGYGGIDIEALNEYADQIRDAMVKSVERIAMTLSRNTDGHAS